jgi:hypothetical protein
MTINIKQSTQFTIKKLALNSKAGPFDVSTIFEELNIFDSILTPCMSGSIVLLDSIGLAKRLVLDGSEYLDVSISKDKEPSNNSQTNITRTFRIFKQTNRISINQTTEKYVLHFVSEEMIYS